jgi:transposase InsO family protein
MEALILAARDAHPAWGGRKLKHWLEQRGHLEVPSPSTITAILRRHDRLEPQESAKHTAFQRFERAAPNELWQMDFKGSFRLVDGQRCHPLTVLDDHSRFLVGLCACADETHDTVQAALTRLFTTYGLPQQMVMDNGAPWGDDGFTRHTRLTVWLLRLEIGVSHGRPYHPQTQGKDERVHRTLKAELLIRRAWPDLSVCQPAFDDWRTLYNTERPHEALAFQPPSSRYGASPRPFPATLPELRYPDGAQLRKVDAYGKFSFLNHSLRLGRAFAGEYVGLCPDPLRDGVFQAFFGAMLVTSFDLTPIAG